jgi:tetratricopeptide (TPR) repeat protein
MLVTLPFVLLLLDYWPLKRVASGQWLVARKAVARGQSPLATIVLEKLPLFAVAAASCAVTIYAQQQSGAVRSLERFSFPVRLANALTSYIDYIRQAVWPDRLALFYPHPGAALPGWKIAGAVLLLASLTALALWQARRRPYLIVGWFWYLGTLVPVIGLVQVGTQAMADRYTYVPLIGLFIMFAWGLAEVTAWRPGLLGPLGMAVAALVLACMVLTWRQVGYWRDGRTVWQHTVEVTEGNANAHYLLGLAFLTRNDPRPLQALEHLGEAVRLQPDWVLPNYRMGLVLEEQGRLEEAADYYRRVLALQPEHAEARDHLRRIERKVDWQKGRNGESAMVTSGNGKTG